MSNLDTIGDIVDATRRAFRSGKTLDISFRRKQLKGIYQMIEENESLFIQALYQDLAKPRFEAKMIETDYVLNDVRGMLFNLDKYTRPRKVKKDLVLAFDDAFIHSEPYGVVFIIGTWNYPLMVCLSPLIGAIAAGNAAIIKPSEIAPNSASLMAKLLPLYVDKDCYRIVLGDAEVNQRLLKEKFDYIFFTGSQPIGRKVYSSAVEHFTPVTLELGGKSPVYFDDSALDQEYAYRRILWAKMVNAGQTCVAPDYVLCSERVMKRFIEVAGKILDKFYGAARKETKDMARIVNEKHFKRLEKLLQSTGGKIAFGGEMDASQRYIGPTIVTNVSMDDPLMREEIFGPILPLVKVNSVQEAIDVINQGSKPLTLYIFSQDTGKIDQITKKTSSGSICANDALIHLGIDSLPFGGVGQSGFGVYHGKASFDTFSHAKSVLVRGFNPVLEWAASKRYPPYTESNLKRLLRIIRKRKMLPGDDDSWHVLIIFLLGALSLYLFQLFSNRLNVGKQIL